jgi:hypothetical protein
MKKILMAAVIATVLAGCGAQQCVPDIKNNYIGPPDALLTKAPVEAPPDQSSYNTLSWKDRSTVWQSKYDSQTANVATANRRLGSLEDWKQQNNAVFATAPQGASNASAARP